MLVISDSYKTHAKQNYLEKNIKSKNKTNHCLPVKDIKFLKSLGLKIKR